MSSVIQWFIIVVLCLLIYFLYFHGFIKSLRSMKVEVGMAKDEVKRLIGSSAKEIKRGSNTEAVYNFWYANRLAPETNIKFRIIFDKDNKVTRILK